MAPVVKEMLPGETVSTRQIYLPGGITWRDVTKCDADQLIGGAVDCAEEIEVPVGGMTFTKQVSIEDCPLYIRKV